ncbi:MAG TPA: hypothetical protein VFA65_10095 [Bryobacteraceae bacterium]|nr:hypothetical protein [Bryobacteraceae bacterium]
MNQILGDIRYAIRGFLKTRLFTVVAMISLAFGIGANTAIFSMLDRAIVRLLPVNQTRQLVEFEMHGQHYDAIGS